MNKKVDQIVTETAPTTKTVRVLSVGQDKQLRVKTLELPAIKPQVSSWSKATSWLQ
jgi:hypothetical protein